MLKSSNPAFGKKAFDTCGTDLTLTGRMTINGTINKTLILLVLVVVPAVWVWNMFFEAGGLEAGSQAAGVWLPVGLIGGLMVTLIWLYIEFLRLLSKLRN